VVRTKITKQLRPRVGHWPLLRTRTNSSGTSASLVAAYAAALSITTPSLAKTPGEVHCYNGICHRVKSVDEMQLLVGSETEALTSYYDVPERDSMNVGTITSSGEEFDADSDSHAASSLYPDGTELLVWNPKNQKAAHIRVNDFGPFYMLRTIDVTRGVAEKLEFVKSGIARLKIVVIWAPSPEAARFRRRREYPAVDGYIGRLDVDQLQALKHRLIATAAHRNGYDAVAAAKLRNSLPAYGGADPSNVQARRKAGIANTPRIVLSERTPAVVAANSPLKMIATGAKPPRSLRVTSARAIAAATIPASAIVTARDLDVSVAVASLSAAQDGASQPVAASGYVSQPEFSNRKPWAPSSLLWQQLLMALGVMSAGAVAWRTRPVATGRRVRTASGRVVSAGPALAPVGVTPVAPMPQLFAAFPEQTANDGLPAPERTSNIFVLPQLPHRPAGKSMDELRDEAIAHMETYAYAGAELAYRQLLAAREVAFGPAEPMTASAERQLADCLREQGRYAAADPHYRRALATMAAAAGELHPATADILDDYAVSLLRQGHGGRAEIMARQSLSIRRSVSARGREYAVTLSIVAEALRAQGQLTHAEIEHRSAWATFIAVSGQDSTDAAASMMSLGTVMGELSRFAAAEELLNAGTKILHAACGPEHPAAAAGYALLGELYRRAGALEASATMHNHALAIRERVLGPRHPDTVESVLALATIATDQYRTGDARLLLDRALDALIGGERTHLGPQSRIRGMIVALSNHHDTGTATKIAAE
jgi:rare lipoprotein A (peptidoglycan hydrolase)/tetratricopeptide (TPR) repeat protein